ncbi:hypothetical protein, partial [Tardiphaga sp.]|uniref:hypothetical protein n=1 Tax=Tardiphaga sp. TaxID=1926292 RepID=UPI0025F1D6B2
RLDALAGVVEMEFAVRVRGRNLFCHVSVLFREMKCCVATILPKSQCSWLQCSIQMMEAEVPRCGFAATQCREGRTAGASYATKV